MAKVKKSFKRKKREPKVLKYLSPDDFRESIDQTVEKPTPPQEIPPEHTIYWDPKQTRNSEASERRQGNCKIKEVSALWRGEVQYREAWTGWEVFIRWTGTEHFCVIRTLHGDLLRWQLQKYEWETMKSCPTENGWTSWELVPRTKHHIGPLWIFLSAMPIRDKGREIVLGCYDNMTEARRALISEAVDDSNLTLGKNET